MNSRSLLDMYMIYNRVDAFYILQKDEIACFWSCKLFQEDFQIPLNIQTKYTNIWQKFGSAVKYH